MNCHACPHSVAILRGEFDSKPWDEIPCASCKLHENTFYTVPFDEGHPPEDMIVSPDEAPDKAVLFPADVVTHFIQNLLSLPPEQRDVISWRYQGLQYKEIAERQGVTVSCVEKRHRLAMRDWPALESLFPFKVACRRYRRSRK